MKWKNRMRLEMSLAFILGGHPSYFNFGDDIAVTVTGHYAVVFSRDELSTGKMLNISCGELNHYQEDDFARSIPANITKNLFKLDDDEDIAQLESVKANGERFCVYVKKLYVDIFPGCSFRCVGVLSPIFAMYDDKCVGILMPVRPESVEGLK